jgi:hypothetical protein
MTGYMDESVRTFWERQPGETNAAYQAFALYRDMGITRSHRKLVEQHFGGSSAKLRQIGEWSRKWMWVARAEAYDAEMERRRRLEREEQIQEALDRARRAALLLQRIALSGLQLYQVNSVGEPSTVLLRYLQAGLAEERLALGIPTDISRLEHRGDPGAVQQDFEARRRMDSYKRAREVLR